MELWSELTQVCRRPDHGRVRIRCINQAHADRKSKSSCAPSSLCRSFFPRPHPHLFTNLIALSFAYLFPRHLFTQLCSYAFFFHPQNKDVPPWGTGHIIFFGGGVRPTQELMDTNRVMAWVNVYAGKFCVGSKPDQKTLAGPILTQPNPSALVSALHLENIRVVKCKSTKIWLQFNQTQCW